MFASLSIQELIVDDLAYKYRSPDYYINDNLDFNFF